MPKHKLYGPLDLDSPELSPRTRLDCLHPRRLGTSMVESLSGYISRLAQAHAVSTGILIGKELRFHLSFGNKRPSSPYRDLLYGAHSLNGIGRHTGDWVSLLTTLTGCQHLRSLTMLTWKRLFSEAGLLRTKGALCSECYREWQLQGQPVYEPLLWMLRPVSVCLVHWQLLSEVCPYCQREPYILSGKSCPGYCSLCNRWLGTTSDLQKTVESTTLPGGAVAVAESIAGLLVAAPRFAQLPSAKTLTTNLRRCVDDLAEGNKNRFCRTVALDFKTLHGWLAGSIIPSFGNLVGLCHRLRVPLVRFLTEPLGPGDKDWECAREVVKKQEAPGSPEAKRRRCHAIRNALRNALNAKPSLSPAAVAAEIGYKNVASFRVNHPQFYREIAKLWTKEQGSTSRCSRPLPPKDYQAALEDALKQDPPPSLYDVATKLGICLDTLSRRFPDLCQMVVQRFRSVHRSKVKAVLQAALVENPAPTLREIERRTSVAAANWRKWFPDLHKALALRCSQRHNIRLKQRRDVLEAALCEEPPISGEHVALRTGVSMGHLRMLFPELMNAITARYAAHRRRQQAERREAFRQQVRLTAKELLVAGKYPSRKKIISLIPDPALKSSLPIVVDEARLAIAEFHIS